MLEEVAKPNQQLTFTRRTRIPATTVLVQVDEGNREAEISSFNCSYLIGSGNDVEQAKERISTGPRWPRYPSRPTTSGHAEVF
jgi:hypothetical protein